MIRFLTAVASTLVFTLAVPPIAGAQAKPPAEKPAGEKPAQERERPAPAGQEINPRGLVPLKVDVTIVRSQGSKVISSMPYTLSVNANDNNRASQLRMGAEVPIRSTTFTPADGKSAPLSSYSYRTIGTNIDCSANAMQGDNRYRLLLSVEETSVYGDKEMPQGDGRMADAPAFRSYRSTNSVILRNGESTEFTAAADRISGEVIKITVKLTVLN